MAGSREIKNWLRDVNFCNLSHPFFFPGPKTSLTCEVNFCNENYFRVQNLDSDCWDRSDSIQAPRSPMLDFLGPGSGKKKATRIAKNCKKLTSRSQSLTCNPLPGQKPTSCNPSHPSNPSRNHIRKLTKCPKNVQLSWVHFSLLCFPLTLQISLQN